MDRITEYQPLIKEALEEYAKLLNSPPKPPYQVMLAFDDEHQQYILRKMGWTKKERIRYTILHLSIYNGRIWIDEDWTEDGIATYLLEHGVSNQEIVLGFQPPQIRPYTEFAVDFRKGEEVPEKISEPTHTAIPGEQS